MSIIVDLYKSFNQTLFVKSFGTSYNGVRTALSKVTFFSVNSSTKFYKGCLSQSKKGIKFIKKSDWPWDFEKFEFHLR